MIPSFNMGCTEGSVGSAVSITRGTIARSITSTDEGRSPTYVWHVLTVTSMGDQVSLNAKTPGRKDAEHTKLK